MTTLNDTHANELALSETERRFLKRIAGKYGNPRRKPLLQSLLIMTALIGLAHLLERTSLPSWAVFLLVYFPVMYLFGRYRKFGVFKSKLMRKLALREEAGAAIEPPRQELS